MYFTFYFFIKESYTLNVSYEWVCKSIRNSQKHWEMSTILWQNFFFVLKSSNFVGVRWKGIKEWNSQMFSLQLQIRPFRRQLPGNAGTISVSAHTCKYFMNKNPFSFLSFLAPSWCFFFQLAIEKRECFKCICADTNSSQIC